jgi:hypothetical protein
VLLHEQEALQNRARLALEQILAARLQQGAARLEALVQYARRGARRRREARLQVLQQDRVQLRDRLGVAVIVLHQQFARAAATAGGVAALGRERVLVIEGDAVLAPAGEVVQADAQVLQHRFVAREAQRFAFCSRPRRARSRQCVPMPQASAIQRITCRSRSRRALLEVRLQREGRVAVLGVALLLLELLRLQEGRRLDALVDAPSTGAGTSARCRRAAAPPAARSRR